MDERDVFDLLLTLAVAVAAYVQLYGLANPLAILDDAVAVLLEIDVRIYLVVGGIMGIFFVAYIVVYLPQKDAQRSVERS